MRIVFQVKEKTRNEILLLLTQKSPQLPSDRFKDEDNVRQKELLDPQGREKQFGKYKEGLIASVAKILLMHLYRAEHTGSDAG